MVGNDYSLLSFIVLVAYCFVTVVFDLEMAFCKSLGGLLRQGVVSQTGNVPVTSMLGSLRYMSTKLFVGGK